MRRLIILISILLLGLFSTMIIAQNEAITYKPKSIDNTIINNRPIVYEKGKSGGTFTLGLIGEPKTFNEIQAKDSASINIINHLFIPLFRFNLDENSWEVVSGDLNKGKAGKGYDKIISKDKMELIIYLRDDVYWSDGIQMTSDDWVWYFNDIICNKTLNHENYNSTFLQIDEWKKEQIRYEKINNYSFKILYPSLVAEAELLGNSQPMPKHILYPIAQKNGYDALKYLWNSSTPIEQIVSNGPFIIKEITKDKIVLEKNKNFFINSEIDGNSNQLPYIDKLIYTLINSSISESRTKSISAKQNEYISFLNGRIDAITIDSTMLEDAIRNKTKGNYNIWNGGAVPQFDFLVFNQNPNSKRLKDTNKLSIFEQKTFRKAVSLLIDRKQILNEVYNGFGEINQSLIPEISQYFDKNVKFNADYNKKKAISILANIGIKDKDGDGILEDSNNKIISFEILTNNLSKREKTASLISENLKSIGIKTTVSIEPFIIITKKIIDNDWDCILTGFTGSLFPLTSSNFYLSKGNMHIWNIYQRTPSTEWEAQIDDLFTKASSETNFNKRKIILNEIFSIIYEEMPIILLTREYSFLCIKNEWRNVNWDVWSTIGNYSYIQLFKN